VLVRVLTLFLAAVVAAAPLAHAAGCTCASGSPEASAAEAAPAPCCCTGEDVSRCAGCGDPGASSTPRELAGCACTHEPPRAPSVGGPELPAAMPARPVAARAPGDAPCRGMVTGVRALPPGTIPPALFLPLLV